ncbi:MAG: hypothetical protein ACP5HZ_02085, partial [Ferrimicrobium sp.]
MSRSSVLLDGVDVERVVARMAHEIIERLHLSPSSDRLPLSVVGIRSGGVWLGQKLSDRLIEYAKLEIAFSEINIASFRDDRPRTAVLDAAGVDQRLPAEGG